MKRKIELQLFNDQMARILPLVRENFPKYEIDSYARKNMLAMLGDIDKGDDQRAMFLLKRLADYIKDIEWDGDPADLRNFDGTQVMTAEQQAAWDDDYKYSKWQRCMRHYLPAGGGKGNVYESVACVAQEITKMVTFTFGTDIGLAMLHYNQHVIWGNIQTATIMKEQDRHLFVYSRIRNLLAAEGKPVDAHL